YRAAESALAASDPACHLPWWLLAGIGRIESGHASGGRVTADGTTRGRILGPRLDGSLAGTAVITDTDGGALDGDPAYDRAVGPMQFLPSTWRSWGRDGNADGVKDPSNVYDATLGAGFYLCAGGRDLSTDAGISAAVLSYNYSRSYLDSVVSWGLAYRDGVTPTDDGAGTIPAPPTSASPPANSTAGQAPTTTWLPTSTSGTTTTTTTSTMTTTTTTTTTSTTNTPSTSSTPSTSPTGTPTPTTTTSTCPSTSATSTGTSTGTSPSTSTGTSPTSTTATTDSTTTTGTSTPSTTTPDPGCPSLTDSTGTTGISTSGASASGGTTSGGSVTP
ncbi:MAG: hypothetical protein M3Y71_05395, partial [Actinomycetota bacterium]|nr:hypothetical protein [Actinomycetota bacterium]